MWNGLSASPFCPISRSRMPVEKVSAPRHGRPAHPAQPLDRRATSRASVSACRTASDFGVSSPTTREAYAIRNTTQATASGSANWRTQAERHRGEQRLQALDGRDAPDRRGQGPDQRDADLDGRQEAIGARLEAKERCRAPAAPLRQRADARRTGRDDGDLRPREEAVEEDQDRDQRQLPRTNPSPLTRESSFARDQPSNRLLGLVVAAAGFLPSGYLARQRARRETPWLPCHGRHWRSGSGRWRRRRRRSKGAWS